MPVIQTLPHATDDFAIIQESPHRLYVDKTRQIAHLLDERVEDNLFLARPRRFGKTLLISTLEALWQGKQALFRETWIHQNWDWEGQNHQVLRLDMDVRGRHHADTVHEALRETLYLLAGKRASVLFTPNMYADAMLTRLLMDMADRTGRRVVVLVDEYDTPLTENLDRPDRIEGILDVLRMFYGVLKKNAGLTRFVFVTGITRFARAGLFSGANHLYDVSFHPKTSDLLGFTQQELLDPAGTGMGPLITQCAHHLGWQSKELYAALETHYSGYRFARGGPPVYNPFALARCLSDIEFGEGAVAWGASQLPNYWAESGSPKLLFRFLDSDAYSLDTALHDHPDTVEQATFDVAAPHLATLLYQTGYLTRVGHIHPATGQTEWTLDFPNTEVAQTFKEVLVGWYRSPLRQRDITDPERDTLGGTMRAAWERMDVKAIQMAFNTYLRTSHYHLHPPKSTVRSHNRGPWRSVLDYEMHYQALLSAALALMDVDVYGELPAVAGRMDMAAVEDDRVTIVEIKANQSTVHAVRQALVGDYPAHFAARGRPVVVLGLNIDTQTRTLTECAKWYLGSWDNTLGQWENEPFTLPLQQVAALADAEKETLVLKAGLVSSYAG